MYFYVSTVEIMLLVEIDYAQGGFVELPRALLRGQISARKILDPRLNPIVIPIWAPSLASYSVMILDRTGLSSFKVRGRLYLQDAQESPTIRILPNNCAFESPSFTGASSRSIVFFHSFSAEPSREGTFGLSFVFTRSYTSSFDKYIVG